MFFFSKYFLSDLAFLKLKAGAYVLFQNICLGPYREESGLRLCKFQGFYKRVLRNKERKQNLVAKNLFLREIRNPVTEIQQFFS